MGRNKGSANFAGSLEVLAGAPLDARTVVDSKSDLTAANTFPYFHEGITVYVKADKKKYTLIGDDPTVATNWKEEGGGSEGGYKLVSSVTADGVKTYRTLFTELMENVTISSDKTYLLKIFGNSPLYHETSRPTGGSRLGFYQTFNTGSTIFTDNIMLSKTLSEIVYTQSGNDVRSLVPKNGIVVKLFSISVDSAI